MSLRIPGMSGSQHDDASGGDAQAEDLGPMSGGKPATDATEKPDLLNHTPAGDGDAGRANLVADLAKSGAAGGSRPSHGITVGGRTVTMSGAGVLLLVAAVAGGVLFGMNGSLHFERIDLDYNLEENAAETGALDHERLLGDLRASVDVIQVPLHEVQMNPFVWKEQLRPATPDAAPKPKERQVDPAELERQRKQKALETALNGMNLTAVFGGSSPIAVINGESRRVGDSLGDGIFAVLRIDGPGEQGGPRVVLEVAEDHRVQHRYYVLVME